MKGKALLRVNFLLIVLFLGAFSVFMLREQARLGFCSDKVIVVPDDYPKISWAVGNASEGDTIFVKSGVYPESLIVVDRNVVIVGENADDTVVDGGETASYIFHVIASHVVVENFTLKNTDTDPFSYSYAIQIYNVTNVTVKNVVVTDVVIGVDVRSSNHTRVMYSRINRSITWGVRFRDASYNNTVVGNTFMENPTAVIFADDKSKFNRVYHNNFINNTHHIVSYAINYFDDGYPSGGNHWSDHVTPDLKFGPYQNETGSDGILDEGYPAGATTPWDKYPLLHPFSKFEIAVDHESFEIQLSTNSTLDSYEFNSEMKKLVLFLSEADDTNGSCRVSIPKRLLSCDSLTEWQVSIYNGDQIPYLALEDENRTYIYFTYDHADTEVIEIKGKKAMSASSPVTTLTLLLATITIIIVLAIITTKIVVGKVKAKKEKATEHRRE